MLFAIALSYKIRVNQSRHENNDDVDDVSPGIIRACIWGPYGALPRINKCQAVFFGIALSYKIKADMKTMMTLIT